MTDTHPYTAENSVASEQLRTYLSGLTDADLNHPMPAGWTVAAVLGHLAFWDRRALTLIEKWLKEGVGPSPIDTDVVNEATRCLCLAIMPRAAVETALAAATAVDQAIAGLSPAMLADIETNGRTVLLNRGKHRHTHLAEIAQALGR